MTCAVQGEQARRLVGTVLTLPGSALAELTADPWDIVWIDLEHGALDRLSAQEMLIGAQAAGACALIRIPGSPGAEQLAAAMLDAGADGIVVPDVTDAAEAARIAHSLRLPPAGVRGYGPRRQTLRGRSGRRLAEPILWMQIESRDGVDNAVEIAAVDGVDALILGTADLSYALGVPLRFDSIALADAAATVRDAARGGGALFGVAGPLLDAHGQLAISALAPVFDDVSVLVHSTEARVCASAIDLAAEQLRRLTPPGPGEDSSDDGEGRPKLAALPPGQSGILRATGRIIDGGWPPQ